jgi:hypothetical protein
VKALADYVLGSLLVSSKLGMTLLSSSWSTVGPIVIRLEFCPLRTILLSGVLVFIISRL